MFEKNTIYVLKVSGEEIYLNMEEASNIWKAIERGSKNIIIRGDKGVNIHFYSSLLPFDETKTGKSMGQSEKMMLFQEILNRKELK